ncbi:polycystic kidney disease protein 1-like 3 [Platysternon megacephalum]|uniref:Polycystic kidney disease protein 1-like 3 n=1 Tax=Platysternon megacephalum TaxID=55544 RepID=A0A4D9EAX5_9SAUR|nr:polycystic kidney disease protein 1-like 3 [Platysternon megacephalum]
MLSPLPVPCNRDPALGTPQAARKQLQASAVIYFHELMAIKGPNGGAEPECLMRLGCCSQASPVKGTGLFCQEQLGAALCVCVCVGGKSWTLGQENPCQAPPSWGPEQEASSSWVLNLPGCGAP